MLVGVAASVAVFLIARAYVLAPDSHAKARSCRRANPNWRPSDVLADRARIFVQGGRGGDGVASFRREAHVPLGGPDGADGGHGGSVELLCDDSLRDLQAFRRRSHFKAPRARHGEGSNRIGADGATLEVKVPPGTQVTLEDGTVHDLVVPGTRIVVAKGGTGGRGNKRFATATRQAPRFAERGLPGEESWIELQLKLLADVGLVGLPNAGKSSLLSRITRAAPKVADYPFTTLEPVLGRSTPPIGSSSSPTSRDSSRAPAWAPASATTSSRTSSARGCSYTSSTSRRSTARTRSTTTRRSRPSSPRTIRASRRSRGCWRCPRPTS